MTPAEVFELQKEFGFDRLELRKFMATLAARLFGRNGVGNDTRRAAERAGQLLMDVVRETRIEQQ